MARRVLLVHAFESGSESTGDPLWSPDDRAWATRLTCETEAAETPPAAFLQARADHALQRLAPRDPAIERALSRRRWGGVWVAVAVAVGVGLIAGIAADAIGSGQEINLLAPPFWGVILWNLMVYLFV
ncbi:MAG: DUF2868 domain-containing protein, partial [Pseudomonadota bacterium]|nr:DUF2868 domain-containing protein [Pseudomonadota bacterium]